MQEPAMPEKTRILWVDDNRDMLEMYRMLLTDAAPDFENVGFLHTLDRLEAEIEAHAPDIVVLDFSMPGGGSLEAMKVCRERFPSVQFVVLSAHDDSVVTESSLAAGASAYKVKDGDIDALVECLRGVAAHRG